MNAILSILTGQPPKFVKEADQRRYFREYRRKYFETNPGYSAIVSARKREKYRTDPEFRAKMIASEKARRSAWTPEQRAAERARRKARIARMTPKEFQAYSARKAEACRLYRARKKLMKAQANAG